MHRPAILRKILGSRWSLTINISPLRRDEVSHFALMLTEYITPGGAPWIFFFFFFGGNICYKFVCVLWPLLPIIYKVPSFEWDLEIEKTVSSLGYVESHL